MGVLEALLGVLGTLLGVLGAFSFDFSLFLLDFEGFWKGFGRAFCMFFRIFMENSDFVKNSVFPREN